MKIFAGDVMFAKFKAKKNLGVDEFVTIVNRLSESVYFDIFVKRDNFVINGKSIMGWAALGILNGDEVVVECQSFDISDINRILVDSGLFEAAEEDGRG